MVRTSVWAGRRRPQAPPRVAALYVSAALLAGILLGGGLWRESSGREPANRTVTVEPGDSLWSIAVRQAPHADPRTTVDRIMARNGLRSARIVPGQRLEVR